MSDYGGDRRELWSKILNLVMKVLNYYANG